MYYIDDKDFDEKDLLSKENHLTLNLDIDGFNGPLDLLLQLAQTKKLDISKISILEPTFNKGDSVYDTVSVLNKMIFKLIFHFFIIKNNLLIILLILSTAGTYEP